MIDVIAGEEREVTAILAYRLWEKRVCRLGSPEVDWFEAKEPLATAPAKAAVSSSRTTHGGCFR
jgi:hypothetical protein